MTVCPPNQSLWIKTSQRHIAQNAIHTATKQARSLWFPYPHAYKCELPSVARPAKRVWLDEFGILYCINDDSTSGISNGELISVITTEAVEFKQGCRVGLQMGDVLQKRDVPSIRRRPQPGRRILRHYHERRRSE